MTEQEHPLEFLPELALGVLAEEEAPGIRAHLDTCASCRAEYNIMAEAARLLPYAVEDVEPAPSVKSGLMERIANEPRVLRPRALRPAWQRFGAIAAAAAVLIVLGGVLGAVLAGDGDAGLEAENARQGALVRAVAEGNARRDTFESGAMRANVVYAPGQRTAFALLQGMPALPDGKAYQAWFIEGGAPRPSTVFSSAEDGVWLDSPGDVAGFAAMAFTIEDEDGAQAPSQPPFLVVELGATAGTIDLAGWFALTMD